jgi:hypothetical protein
MLKTVNYAYDDLSVSFKHVEDILPDQYKSGRVFQRHSDRIVTLEERRHDLKKDYDHLQQFRPIKTKAEEA